MVKQFILLIQLIGVFFYQLVLTGDVTVSQKMPDTIQAGEEAVVEIIVNKSDASGFAKVQQDIPAGFTVEPIETKGATFSFKENRIKFIWMALPSEEEFAISYKLKALETTKGDFSIGGKFSFIADSERKNIVIADSKFKVTEEVMASITEESTEEEEENTTEEIVEENSEETSEEEIVEVEETTESTEEETPTPEKIEITLARTIEKQEDESFKVSLTLKKKGVEGFAKVTEEIPAGFIASEIESNGGVFSFKNGVAKILWMAIPNSDEFIVSYNVKSTTANNGNYTVNGEFAYLEDDVTQKKEIAATSFELNIEAIAEEVTIEEEEENTAEEEKENTEVETEEEEVLVNEENTEDETDTEVEEDNSVANKEDNITSVPNPETGVSYKVQVGAGHQTVPANYFATKFNLQDNVSTENHEGWIKYLVGSFNVYKAARDKRNKVRNNVKTAFVTAYNSGKRITVQEALMISNQKWYK